MYTSSFIQISYTMGEMLCILLGSCSPQQVEYRIHNSRGDIVRKGCFTGLSAYIRLTTLPADTYALNIGCTAAEPITYSFVKKDNIL